MDYLIPSIDGKQMLEVDRLMIEKYQISLLQMMEHAGENLARLVQRYSENLDSNAILILCGNGHNGGGGMVCARFLLNWGYDVCIVTIGNPSRRKTVTIQQHDNLQAMGANILEHDPKRFPDLLAHSDIVVDAMIGYGLEGDLSEELQIIIDELQKRRELTVISLDAPSGLNVSGEPVRSKTIHARATLTLALPKQGLLLDGNRAVVGELFLADIGVPRELYEEMGIEVATIFRKSSMLLHKSGSNYAPV